MNQLFRKLSFAVFFAAAFFIAGVSADSVQAAPYGSLYISGQRGESVTRGGTYHITEGNWRSTAFASNDTDACDILYVQVDGLPSSQLEDWFIGINTAYSGVPITTGTRTVPEHSTEISFLITSSGRAAQTFGTYTIHELVLVPEGEEFRCLRLTLSFEMSIRNATGPRDINGLLRFVDDGSSIPQSYPLLTKAKYSRSKNTLKLSGLEFEAGATVTVDGMTELTVAKVSPRTIKAKNVTLSAGIHTIVVKNLDGGETLPFEIAVFSSFQPDTTDGLSDTIGDDQEE